MRKTKTTLMVDDSTYAAAKRRAAEEGKSVSWIVSEALHAYLSASTVKPRQRVSLVTAKGGDWIGPADPRSNAELLDAAGAEFDGLDADLLKALQSSG